MVTLSAMKMETPIPITASGSVKRVAVVNVGDKVNGDRSGNRNGVIEVVYRIMLR